MGSIGLALLNSLDIGLLLFVIAVGLNIIFGVLNVINFAHGALYMLGAYLAYTCIILLGMPFWLTLLVAPLGVAALAVLIDRLMLRFIYQREVSDSLLLTFALLLILNESVRLLWGTGIHVVDPPAMLQGTVVLPGGVTYPTYSLFVVVVGLVFVCGLWFLFNRTRAGKIMRAAALDREMAQVLCINTKLVITAVFAFGAWLAAWLPRPCVPSIPAWATRLLSRASSLSSSAGWAAFQAPCWAQSYWASSMAWADASCRKSI
jgi:branched-chain amino acid transport system permease protein